MGGWEGSGDSGTGHRLVLDLYEPRGVHLGCKGQWTETSFLLELGGLGGGAFTPCVDWGAQQEELVLTALPTSSSLDLHLVRH